MDDKRATVFSNYREPGARAAVEDVVDFTGVVTARSILHP
jgi:hypothetical protein